MSNHHGHHIKMFDSQSAESSESSESSEFAAKFKPHQVENLVEIFYELLFRGKNWTSVFADIETLEREIADLLGAKVQLNHGRKGSGKLVIHYHGLDTLDGILEKLRR